MSGWALVLELRLMGLCQSREDQRSEVLLCCSSYHGESRRLLPPWIPPPQHRLHTGYLLLPESSGDSRYTTRSMWFSAYSSYAGQEFPPQLQPCLKPQLPPCSAAGAWCPRADSVAP